MVESIKKLKKLKGLSIDETGLTESAMSELKSLRLELFILRRIIYPGFVWINPDTFKMGSPEGEADREDDETQHEVTLTEGFYLGKYEVTQEEYKKVMGKNPSHFLGDDRRPVESVSWYEAIDYCNERSKQEGLSPYYQVTEEKEVTILDVDGEGYRLPTEAEWEYACRAGTTTAYHFGEAERLDDYAWYEENSDQTTHVVGEKNKPNAFKLHDMHGNVWEWCWDWYDEYPTTPQENHTGPSEGSFRADPRPACGRQDVSRRAKALRSGRRVRRPWSWRVDGKASLASLNHFDQKTRIHDTYRCAVAVDHNIW